MEEKKQKYYCRSTLIARGWTDSLIKKFLVHEDARRGNPLYKCASPMKLYDRERVKKIERKKDFKTAKEKSEKRSKRMVEIADSMRNKMLDYVMSLEIKLPDYPYDVVLDNAIESYNDFHWDDYDRHVDRDSDASFLKRICTNYLRHECTFYEHELERMFGKVGVHEAHDLLQRRINDAIRDKYPELR